MRSREIVNVGDDREKEKSIENSRIEILLICA